MSNPQVAVVVPCWNYERWIHECVKSIAIQSYRPLYLICIHDGCDRERIPPTGLVLTADPGWLRTTYYRKTNGGVSCARNDGLQFANESKYVWFLDADDMAIPGGIEARVEYLEKHPDVDMVWGNALKINAERRNFHWGYTECMANLGKLERYSRRLNAQTLLWRTSVFTRFGGYFEGLRSKEDKELLFRLGLHPESPFEPLIKARHIDADVAIYRRHPDAKHKMRIADKKWCTECEHIFARRIKQLKREGITKENTRFPSWA